MLILSLLACELASELGGSQNPLASDIVLSSVGPGPHPFAHRLVVTTPSASAVAVGCWADDDAVLWESEETGTRHEVRLVGLLAGTHYTCAARTLEAGGLSAPTQFTTPAVASPTRLVDVTGTVEPGFVVLNHTKVAGNPAGIAILDLQGRLRWTYALPRRATSGIEALLDGQGGLWWGGGVLPSGPRHVSLWDRTALNDVLVGPTVFHHDGKLVEDGRLVTLEVRENSLGDRTFEGFGIRLVEPRTGEVTWEYSSQSGVDSGRLTVPPRRDDVFHANWVDYQRVDDDGFVFVSLCHAHQIVAIRESTQSIAWILGRDGDVDLPPGDQPSCQHGPEVDEAGTRWLVYDNGRDVGQSRIIAYTLDPARRRATVDWEWTRPGWFSPILGDVDWTQGGDVFVTMATTDEPLVLTLLDGETREVRWEATLAEPTYAYRAELVGGCDVFDTVVACPEGKRRMRELFVDLPAWGG